LGLRATAKCCSNRSSRPRALPTATAHGSWAAPRAISTNGNHDSEQHRKKSTTLRKLLNSGEILYRPSIGLAIHAIMVEAAGFKVVNVSGAQTAAHILGLPDAGLITMTEVVDNVRRNAAVVNIPVIADCDTGFGNAINVRRAAMRGERGAIAAAAPVVAKCRPLLYI
jgi:isocitrate lyase